MRAGLARQPAPFLNSGVNSSGINNAPPVIRTRINRTLCCVLVCTIVGVALLGMSVGFEPSGGIFSKAAKASSLSNRQQNVPKRGGRNNNNNSPLSMAEFNDFLSKRKNAEGYQLLGGATSRRAHMVKSLFLSSQISRETIFVNIASFRDRLCMESVREIYAVSKNPERIYVGVVDQRIVGDQLSTPTEYLRTLPKLPAETTQAPKGKDPELPATPLRFLSCYKTGGFCPSDNIRSRVVWDREARGPTYGRFVGGLLFQGESFYMMMDSHSRFLPNFDEYMILDVLRMRDSYVSTPSTATATYASGDGTTDTRYSSDAIGPGVFTSPEPIDTKNQLLGGVLSYYPSGFDLFGKPVDANQQVMAMCKTAYVDSLQVLRNGAMWIPQPRRPLRQPNTAAGFLFSESTAQLRVPFDPYLDFVFDGEEILYTARLYTSGYDSYTPGRTYIFHHYNRKHAPRYWSVPKTPFGRIQPFTRQRAHYFLETYEKNPLPKADTSKDKAATVNPHLTRRPDKLIMDHERAVAKGLAVSEEIYGMGTVRSIASFYAYSHVNTSTWDVSQEALCIPASNLAKALTNKFKE